MGTAKIFANGCIEEFLMEQITMLRRSRDFKSGLAHGKSALTRSQTNYFPITKEKTSPSAKGKFNFDFPYKALFQFGSLPHKEIGYLSKPLDAGYVFVSPSGIQQCD